MVGTTTPAATEAYYAKEQLRILRVKLDGFRNSLRICTNPKQRAWLQSKIEELLTALFERTGMRY